MDSYKIKLSEIQKYCPLDSPIWMIFPAISESEIELAINLNKFRCEPMYEDVLYTDLNEFRDEHISRIAYLIVNGWDDPIQLDVGIPGHYEPPWLICDGNHRYIAANYLKHEYIEADYTGCVNTFESMFTV